jgi:PTH1 family peptidyl-tRNA hydrolase
MKLIVGLGNPGDIYRDSRHNIGFSVVKTLAKTYKIALKRESGCWAFTGKGKIGDEVVILAMPLTFMNLSGNAVNLLLKKYKISLENLLVVCDDLDLEFGRLKIRPSGSSGGQRGLKSIIAALKSQEFCRLRIGIGRPHPDTDAASFVLSHFRKKEKEQFKDIIEKAGDCCRVWVTRDITESMNIFNRRRNNESRPS